MLEVDRIQRCPYLYLNQLSASSSIFHFFPLNQSYSLYEVSFLSHSFLPSFPLSLLPLVWWGRMSEKGNFFFPLSFQMLQFICSYIYTEFFPALRPSNLSATAEHCHKHLYSSDIQATKILSYTCRGPCSRQPHWVAGKQNLYQFYLQLPCTELGGSSRVPYN